ncbi:MAG TPA: hypothetical protein IGS53_04095 [Leptolyngbyaceae cyanobacterium M33_DOE_097]|uniref:Uncharacterized protein n=1 Tax=Oscillatoriales cyanobacterium SpSt-418 TaxID=2282169 RepID=A0A7C3PIY9_9CYAN|nr:hypothetical protein [Leptolyngbyaceae cyanobacterium M33_DOE_097]
MKLETEFRIYLQLQSFLREATRSRSAYATTAYPPAESVWVVLQSFAAELCGQEALLLCRTGETKWLAWVPDYGEVTLERGMFSLPC